VDRHALLAQVRQNLTLISIRSFNVRDLDNSTQPGRTSRDRSRIDPERQCRAKGPKMRIDYTAPVLAIDDQPIMLDLTRRILSRLGFEVIDYEPDGERGLARLRLRQYQLVVCDMHMSPVNGLQLLRSVRQDQELKDTRFILMTGSVEPSTVMAAKQAGADAYLLKPFTPEQLKGKVDEVFSRHHPT
jgi:two-component system, chemotaxis family, chemotaxis protein CheY